MTDHGALRGRLQIVNKDGEVMTYQGKRLEFAESERERAEMILWLLGREAKGGPFVLVKR